MNKNDGGSAYAKIVVPEKASGVHTDHPGMSQRDYGEWAALQGLLATIPYMLEAGDRTKIIKDTVSTAREAADVMLKAREDEG